MKNYQLTILALFVQLLLSSSLYMAFWVIIKELNFFEWCKISQMLYMCSSIAIALFLIVITTLLKINYKINSQKVCEIN